MTSKATPCPLCGKNGWHPHNDGVYEFRHGRKSYSVPDQQYALCDHCGTKGFLPGQRDFNRSKIREFQQALLEYISPSDVLAVREKYCLSQSDASKIFGGGTQGFSKWERGTAVPAGTTARLIKLALAVPLAMQHLAEQCNVVLTHEKAVVPKKGTKVIALYEMINRENSEIIDNEQLNQSENDISQYEYDYK
jgi:HTH-type transcriptional regulator / antitoxin MqsA